MAKAKSKTRFNLGYGAIYQRKTKDSEIRWYIDYRTAEGKRIQRVAGDASSREEAEQELRRAVLACSTQAPGVERKPGRPTFSEFARIYIDDYAMSAKRSWREDVSRMKILKPFFKDVYLDEVTPLMIRRFRNWRLEEGNAKSTTNRYLALLKNMFNVAIDEGYVSRNPVAKIKFYSEKENQKERILTMDEEARLMEAAYPVLQSFMIVALNTGMRRGEILDLRWDQIDFDRLTLTVEKTKSGKSRTIPLNAALQSELLRLKSLDGRSPFVFPNEETGKAITTVTNAFRAACRRAGIQGLRFHDFRHTFATRLVENGADIETTRSLLGHSTYAMTQRYVHSTDERRRAAVEKLAAGASAEPQNGGNL